MIELLKQTDFYKWFDEYSQANHHLKGWEEYDQYLDEVELPDILFLTIVQKWLRELPTPVVVIPTTDFVAWNVEILNPDRGRIILTKNSKGRWFDSYEEALEAGLKEALKLI